MAIMQHMAAEGRSPSLQVERSSGLRRPKVICTGFGAHGLRLATRLGSTGAFLASSAELQPIAASWSHPLDVDIVIVGWRGLEIAAFSNLVRTHRGVAFIAVPRIASARLRGAYSAAGASAVVEATRGLQVLAAAALIVSVGMKVVPSPPTPNGALTPREAEILMLLDTDLRLPEVASVLALDVETVRSHTKRIYRKLGVHNRSELRRVIAEGE